MIYSYTQISQYLTCPRRYRHRYLDGWQEKTTHAAMLFGRAFERALAAFFLRQDAAAAMFQEWALHKNQKLQFSHGDSWDRMLEQGISTARPLLPGGSGSHPPAPPQPADQVCTTDFRPE